MNTKSLILFFAIFLFTINIYAQEYTGFKVQGRFLYDACGEKVILRGVSNPNIWFQKNGNPQMAEIEKTGANVVRIVWETGGSPSLLDQAISNCRSQNMIPMVELHDATGNLDKLQICVDYWIKDEVVTILQKHEAYLLVNIANEPGNYSVSENKFRTTYESAVQQIRTAGIHVPLIIDGTDWGKNVNIMQSEGPALIEADPDHNLIFSVHMWWPKMYSFTEQDIINEIAQSAEMGLPMIVGEFSQMHGACDESTITDNNSIAYKTIISECEKMETGYIAWSWFGNCNSFWDMSTEGTFESLYDWGLEVAVTDENSIQNTSVRPHSMLNNGECKSSVGIPEFENDINKGFSLSQNYPNPANNETTISYSLSKKGKVQLIVTDLQGKILMNLINTVQNKGDYSILINTETIESGLYLYTLKVNDNRATRKMIKIS